MESQIRCKRLIFTCGNTLARSLQISFTSEVRSEESVIMETV
jgi:hypothetical protein